MDFAAKAVLVTGSSSGIGRGCAEGLLERGARVAGFDVKPAAIRHERFEDFHVDVTDEKAVADATAESARRFGAIDGLATCAGVPGCYKPFYEMTAPEWARVLAANLTGTWLCAKYAALEMMKRKAGRIVTIGCVTPIVFGARRAEYSSSKGGVAALTSAMAMDLAGFGIQVNSVAPGMTRTGFTEARLKDPEVRKSFEKTIPLGRVGEPEDIARVVIFLLSDEAAYMTGQTVVVDGGYSKAK